MLLSIFPPQPALCLHSSSDGGLCWACHAHTACTRKLLTVTSTRWFCKRIPAFAESGIEPVSSVLGTFVDIYLKPLLYQRDDSIGVFSICQQSLGFVVLQRIVKWRCLGHLVFYIDCLTVCLYRIFLCMVAWTYAHVITPSPHFWHPYSFLWY